MTGFTLPLKSGDKNTRKTVSRTLCIRHWGGKYNLWEVWNQEDSVRPPSPPGELLPGSDREVSNPATLVNWLSPAEIWDTWLQFQLPWSWVRLNVFPHSKGPFWYFINYPLVLISYKVFFFSVFKSSVQIRNHSFVPTGRITQNKHIVLSFQFTMTYKLLFLCSWMQ